MSWTRRLPAGDLLIDLRPAEPPQVVSGIVFAEVAQDLRTVELVPQIRVWVLHDVSAQWCAGAAHLERGLRAWLTAAAAGQMQAGTSEVVVLPPAAARQPALVAAIQALGLPVHPMRRGGGLPLNSVEVEGRSITAVTTPALAPVPLPASLQPALDRLLGR